MACCTTRLGGAAQEQMAKPVRGRGADDDQVGVLLDGGLQEHLGRHTELELGRDLHALLTLMASDLR